MTSSQFPRDLIFLSAQPDDFFFSWQIELQVFNLNELGVPKDNIHVLVAYNPRAGVRPHFQEIMDKYERMATFYPYPETKRHRKYIPSVRANIIHQHFTSNKWLSSKTIFYHDSDIIFREIPDFTSLMQDDIWYVSDTRSYLDSSYVTEAALPGTFIEMCDIVGITQQQVIENDKNCGGAQYLLKDIPEEFWLKVERNSEELYELLWKDNRIGSDSLLRSGQPTSGYNGIQAWCADMWGLFYNILYFGKSVQIAPELAFCWAADPISEWHKNKILHYTGEIAKDDKTIFNKARYQHFTPYLDPSLEQVSPNNASSQLVNLIDRLNKNEEAKKIDLSDVVFCYTINSTISKDNDNLIMHIRYLRKYIRTKIVVFEYGQTQTIDQHQTTTSFDYIYIPDSASNKIDGITDLLTQSPESTITVICDPDFITPVGQIIQSVTALRSGISNVSTTALTTYPDIEIRIVDHLFRLIFSKLLDPGLFIMNSGKFALECDNSRNAYFACSTSDFLKQLLPTRSLNKILPDLLKDLLKPGIAIHETNGPQFKIPVYEQ